MTDLTSLTANTPILTDIIYTVDDPGGTPAPRKATFQAIMDLYEANMTVPSSVSSAYLSSTTLASTANGDGASLIGIEDAGTLFTATTVEAALAENRTAIDALEAAAHIANVSEDATPTLGGPLDVDGNSIVSTANGDITIAPNGTGNVVLGNYTLNADATVGVGQDNFVLTYDNGTGLWGPEATGGGDVSISGTPADTYLATWASASAIEGASTLTWDGTSLGITGDIVLTERAAVGWTPVAGYGALWVSNDATQKLYFTSDAGTNNEVLTSGSGTTLLDATATTSDKFVFFDTDDSDNPKTSNDLIGDLSIAVTTGNSYTGVHNFGGATDFEIPNGTTQVVDTDGQMGIDTSVADLSHGLLKYYSGEEMGVVAMPIVQYTTPTDGYVVAYNATNDEFELVDNAGAGIAAVVNDAAPQLGGMLDVNGNAIGDGTLELLTFTEDGSAVNHVNIENEATGSGPIISAAGDDTNVDLNLAGKGTGIVAVGSSEVVTLAATQTLTNKTLTAPVISTISNTGTVTLPTATDTLVGLATTDTLTNKTLTNPVVAQINDANGNEALLLTATASAVNEVTIANAATTNGPTISATGETNVDLILAASGTGIVKGADICIPIAISDETTALTTGTSKLTYYMPRAFTLTDIHACVTTAPTGATLIIDVNDGGTSIMTTNKLVIDVSENDTTTAATAPTLTDTAIAAGAALTFDIDQVGSTVAGAGAKVTLMGYWT